jgi:PleD family two-component response regulator
MGDNNPLNPLVARRRLSYLATFENKIHSLRRGLEQLERAAEGDTSSEGRLPTDELERVSRSLVSAGLVYGLDDVTTWANDFLSRVDEIRKGDTGASEEDVDWLASQILALQEIRDAAIDEAQAVSPNSILPSMRPKQSGSQHVQKPDQSIPPPPSALAAEKRVSSPPKPVPDAPTDTDGRPTASLPGLQKAGKATVSPGDKSAEQKTLLSTIATPSLFTQTTIPTAAIVVSNTISLRNEVIATMGKMGFEMSAVAEADTAHEMLRTELPDIVIIDMDDPAPGGQALIDAMGRDPLTDFIPVLKLVPADALEQEENAVAKPINKEHLAATARHIIAEQDQPSQVLTGLRDISLLELTEFVQSELRAGVAESAAGPDVAMRFSVKEEASIVAGVWALVSHLRRVIAEGSGGKIRFIPTTRDQVGIMPLPENEDIFDPLIGNLFDENVLESLKGLNVIVADDDAKVRQVFSRVLGEAGIDVRTYANGVEVLMAVDENPPDLVITDILMPKMDGWELGIRIKRNYALKHIPVIIISWKEDFLQRVRKLKVGADDFMLKELSSQQILERVARMLRPRFSLEQRLQAGGDVTGRVEQIGVLGVLRTTMKFKRNARVTFRDNWNDFEVDILDGEIAAVTRTGTDGSFASSSPALGRLMGTEDGRFEVIKVPEKTRRQFPKEGPNVIVQATNRLNDMVDQVVDGALINIASIELDDDVLENYAKVTPNKLKVPLEQLRAEKTPREVVNNAIISPDAMETLLLDMIRTGVMRNIESLSMDSDDFLVTAHDVEQVANDEFELIAEESETPSEEISQARQAGEPEAVPEAVPAGEVAVSGGPEVWGQVPANRETPSVVPFTTNRWTKSWQVIAMIAIVLLGISIYFNFNPKTEQQQSDMALEGDAVPPSESKKPEQVKPSAEVGAPEQPKAQATQEEPARAAETKAEKAAAPEQAPGFLVVDKSSTDDGGPIKVSVNQRLKGRTPLRIELAPGSYDIAFSRKGKRRFKKVTVVSNQESEMVATVPR